MLMFENEGFRRPEQLGTTRPYIDFYRRRQSYWKLHASLSRKILGEIIAKRISEELLRREISDKDEVEQNIWIICSFK